MASTQNLQGDRYESLDKTATLKAIPIDSAVLAEKAFADYQFGSGVMVTDTSGWEYTTPGHERTRKVYVETECEDDGPAPRWVLTFTVRFDPSTGSLSEAYALDDHGQVWGAMPGQRNVSNDTGHTELPPIKSNVSVRLVDGVVVNGVVTEHSQKDGKPTFDFDYYHRTRDGQIIKASKWAWPEMVVQQQSVMDKGKFLRTKALALLQEAQSVDGLKPFTVTHIHSGGETTYVLWAAETPTQVQAEAVLDFEFEPDREETLVIEDCFTLEEMTGVSASANLPEILESISSPGQDDSPSL